MKATLSRWRGKRGKLPEEFWDDWEAALLQVDLGVPATSLLLEEVRKECREQRISDPASVRERLEENLSRILKSDRPSPPDRRPSPQVIMVVGVNGTGKTTTIAKLAYRYQNNNRRVLLAAGDTFRAAAIEQLEIWARRLKTELIQQDYGSDPAAVAFDSLKAARARAYDYLIIDTAGRLHTQSGLMEELRKIVRVLRKVQPTAPEEIFLVLDASVGQNGLVQAREFARALPLTGLIVTKLDGTARGGIVVAVQSELKVPVVALGVGEEMSDLLEFNPPRFAHALLA